MNFTAIVLLLKGTICIAVESSHVSLNFIDFKICYHSAFCIDSLISDYHCFALVVHCDSL